MKRSFKVVITGGGTSGHITPALSIAKSLEIKHQADIHYLGNEKFIEKELVTKAGYPFYSINSQGLEGKNFYSKWKNFIFKNGKGIIQAFRILKKIKPDFIISTGGFVTSPVLTAAKILKIPYFIHEQNTVLGRVNKLFLNDAKQVYYSFENTIGGQENRKGIVVGNPVPINQAIDPGYSIVVLGGSGGSEFLNEWALSFAQEHSNIPIHLQVGKKNAIEIEKRRNKNGIYNLSVYGYVNILEMYKKAKFVVTRGGTSSLFELANAEIPSIIVPLPNSMDNHQFRNGMHFQQLGGMVVVEQKEQLAEKQLDKTVLEWWTNEELLNSKRIKLREFPYKNCSDIIVENMLNYFVK